jgi:hypothetical protein
MKKKNMILSSILIGFIILIIALINKIFFVGEVLEEYYLDNNNNIRVVLRTQYMRHVIDNYYNSIIDEENSEMISEDLSRRPVISLDSTRFVFSESKGLYIYTLLSRSKKYIGRYTDDMYFYEWLSANRLLVVSTSFFSRNIKEFNMVLIDSNFNEIYLNEVNSFDFSTKNKILFLSNCNNSIIRIDENNDMTVLDSLSVNMRLLFYVESENILYLGIQSGINLEYTRAIAKYDIETKELKILIKFKKDKVSLRARNKIYREGNLFLKDNKVEIWVDPVNIDTIYNNAIIINKYY